MGGLWSRRGWWSRSCCLENVRRGVCSIRSLLLEIRVQASDLRDVEVY